MSHVLHILESIDYEFNLVLDRMIVATTNLLGLSHGFGDTFLDFIKGHAVWTGCLL